jgi:hypothetical protein
MSENPYEPPTSRDMPPERLVKKSSSLDPNLREMLGIAKDDIWGYLSVALLVAGCFPSNVAIVFALFAASTAFLVLYLVKSFPKCLGSSDLAPAIKVYGLISNIAWIPLHIAVIAGKCWFLFGRP